MRCHSTVSPLTAASTSSASTPRARRRLRMLAPSRRYAGSLVIVNRPLELLQIGFKLHSLVLMPTTSKNRSPI
jgi:hypothetical protein